MATKLATVFLLTVSWMSVVLGWSLNSRDDVVCYFAPTDVIFVMDESQTVGLRNFNIGLNAAATLTDSLVIGTGSNNSRVGFVLFDMDGHLVFGLNQYTNNADVANAIRNVSYGGGDTNIAGGMQIALEEFKVHYNPRVKRLMILVTDGKDDSNVTAMHKLAVDNGVEVWALGIGADSSTDELTKATGDPSHVISIDDYSEVLGAFQQICYQIGTTVEIPATTAAPVIPKTQRGCGCDDSTDERILDVWLDIVVIVDSSSVVSYRHFEDIKEFLIEMAYSYPIAQSADPNIPGKFTRVALINNAETAAIVANLSDFKSKDDMVAAVYKLQKQEGFFDPSAGITLVNQIVNEKDNSQDRLNARTVVMLFSSSHIDCDSVTGSSRRKSSYRRNYSRRQNLENEDMCEMIAQMKTDGVLFVTVGVALDGEAAPYIDIAEPCNRINNTEDMAQLIMVALCRANCYCLPPTTQYVVGSLCDPYAECLYLHEIESYFSGAEAVCVREDGHLPDVFTKEKQAFLNQLHIDAGRTPYWLGGTVKNGTIIWKSGRYNTSASGENGDYTNWDPNYKEDPTKPCIAASAGFALLWNTAKDVPLMAERFYSCQSEACSVLHYCD